MSMSEVVTLRSGFAIFLPCWHLYSRQLQRSFEISGGEIHNATDWLLTLVACALVNCDLKMSMAKLSSDLLSLAGEYAVASELCRRGLYSQLTLGNHKRTDILIETDLKMFRIQVKAKQGGQWPAVSGLSRKDDFLVLVDFAAKGVADREDFYILDLNDWLQIIAEESKKPEARIDEENKVKYVRQKDGKEYVDWRGVNIIPSRVSHCKEEWLKILSRIDPEKTEAKSK